MLKLCQYGSWLPLLVTHIQQRPIIARKIFVWLFEVSLPPHRADMLLPQKCSKNDREEGVNVNPLQHVIVMAITYDVVFLILIIGWQCGPCGLGNYWPLKHNLSPCLQEMDAYSVKWWCTYNAPAAVTVAWGKMWKSV